MPHANLVNEIADSLGRALMDIDELIARGVPLDNEFLALADDIDRQLRYQDEWVKDDE